MLTLGLTLAAVSCGVSAAPQFFSFNFPTQQYNPATGRLEYVPAAGQPAVRTNQVSSSPAVRSQGSSSPAFSPSVSSGSNTPRRVSKFDAPEPVVAFRNGFNPAQDVSTRIAKKPEIASLQPKTDGRYQRPIDSNFYASKAFRFPIAVTKAINAARDQSSPNAAAALAYMKNIGNDDICSRSTQVYLEVISQGGSVDEANSAATKIYIDDFNNGYRVEPGSACEASDIAWRKAEAEGKDPVYYSAVAFMENWPGTLEGNPCAVSGRDYVNAIINGGSHTQANLLAAKSFANAIQKLAAQGKELRDPACAAATRAFYDKLDTKPSPPNAAAMLAFLDKAFDGFSFEYDPVCWRSTEGFFNSYAQGNDELTSNRNAAKLFLNEFARGGQQIPADSPCAAATRAYYENIPNPPSPANKAAMEAFMDKMIGNGEREADPVCAASTEAYFTAYEAGASETDANLAAAEEFFRAFSAGDSIPADSPCVAATKAYFKNLPSKPSQPNAEAMIEFMDAMIRNGNKRVYDPACADASLAYFNSFKAGKDELTSNFEAARAFIKQYKKGAKVPADSPCLRSTKVYAANIKNSPSPPNAAAMLAFMDEAIVVNFDKPDPVCLTSAEAYFDAYLSGKTEAQSNEIAGVAFLDAVAATPSFDPSSPCGRSAKAYMATLDL
jgi:hypothetical protein